MIIVIKIIINILYWQKVFLDCNIPIRVDVKLPLPEMGINFRIVGILFYLLLLFWDFVYHLLNS